MANLIPRAYRSVAVTDVDVPLDAASLTDHFLGREAYRRTRWIVASNGGGTVLLGVGRTEEEPLFAPITEVEVLAGADETCVLERPDLDTGIPAQLAQAAADPAATGARCVVVHGRFGHVSFILDPQPVRITVLEVVPPFPAKLLAQAQAVLDVAEDIPPTLLQADEVSLDAVVPPEGAVLLPCRGAEIAIPGRDVSFLDQRPPYAEWTLLGCDRSREIHAWFYGREPAAVVDLCPRRLPVTKRGPLLTKCCLLEGEVRVEPGLAVVPWGASLAQVGQAVRALAEEAAPAWAPA
jgi:hypothetical protein